MFNKKFLLNQSQQQVYTTRHSYMQIERHRLVQNAHSQNMNEGGFACSLINTNYFEQ